MKTDDVGATKLMRACQFGELGEVLSLLAKGADVKRTDSNNSTALMYAIINEDKGVDRGIIIKKLLEQEVDLDARNMQFESAAILAAKNNDPVTLEMLLQRGVKNLEMIDMEGKNVYQYAEKNSCKTVMDKFKNQQPTAEAEPIRRSFLTQVLDVLWSPFKLIGNVLKAIAGAILQVFIDRSAKPRTSSSSSHGSEDFDDEDQEMSDSSTHTVTTIRSQESPEMETSSKKKYYPNKEKKVHLFSETEVEKMRREGELKLRGVVQQSPLGTPKPRGDI
jgi:ankyrin repeat protein